MKKKLIGWLVSLFFLGMAGTNVSRADLVKSDFLAAGDGLLVTDTVTGLTWLSPVFTKGQSYNDILGGFANLLTTDALDPFGKIPEFKFCALQIGIAD